MGDLVSLPGKPDEPEREDLQCGVCGGLIWRIRTNGEIECQSCGTELAMEDWFEGLMIAPDAETGE